CSINIDWTMEELKKTLTSTLAEREREIVEMIEKKSYLSHDLKISLNPCTFYSSHEPVWDGNYYTCAKCGQEFIKAKEINKILADIKALLTKDSKGE
ncbi:MAG: hypothetical protein WD898_02390, partial [Candidatus Paceibacterota bacterium]